MEAEEFKEDFCYRCLNYNEYYGCYIESRAWLYNTDNAGYPEEWVVEDGESGRCTAFREVED